MRLANRMRRGEAGALIGSLQGIGTGGRLWPRIRPGPAAVAPATGLRPESRFPCRRRPPPWRRQCRISSQGPGPPARPPRRDPSPVRPEAMEPHMSASKPQRAGRPPSTGRRMTLMLILFVVAFGGVFGLWFASQRALNSYFDNMPQPPVEVSTFEARAETWSDTAEAVGTLVADNGTQVTTEAGGVVQRIAFESGQRVRTGDLLVQLNTANELAQLNALEAAAELAATQRDRWRELGAQKLVSQAEVDERVSDAAQTHAQAEAQRALIAQKTIRAPFDGVLGIRRINLGQYLNPGDPIV